jgi:UDP-N-acetylglucosamine/UDP-N-acetyl-alpha-D-glucosaminouronate 4-epimerase
VKRMLTGSRVLVTGGAGFIGSHIVDRLRDEGAEVGVLDNFSTGDILNLGGGRRGPITVHDNDVRDYEAVRKVVRDYRVVVHEAALVSVARSVEDPLLVNQVNVDGTLNLLRASVESGVERFVYASSSSAYGDTEALPKRESMGTVPSSPYGASKLAAENYCRVFARVYGLKTVSLRYFNVYGPRQKGGFYSGVIPTFIRMAREGVPPVVYGDGLQTRDFTFVQDVVDANVLAVASPRIKGGEVYNVAGGRTTTINELALAVARLVGAPDLVPEHAEPRRGDIRASYADVSKAREELGYQPKFSLDQGLAETIAWFSREHAQAVKGPAAGGQMPTRGMTP